MNRRWFFSQFFRDATGNRVPVCAAYGGQWFCPRWPAVEDGWALVFMLSAPQQIEAAGFDPRVLVCSGVGSVPQAVADTYSSMGATASMTLEALLTRLAQTEPLFLTQG